MNVNHDSSGCTAELASGESHVSHPCVNTPDAVGTDDVLADGAEEFRVVVMLVYCDRPGTFAVDGPLYGEDDDERGG